MCPLPEALIIEGFAYVKQATIFYLFLVVVVDAVALVVLKKISVQMTKPPTNIKKKWRRMNMKLNRIIQTKKLSQNE